MNISEQTDSVLLQWLANAATTGAMALGHHKGQQNDRLVNSYEKELGSRNVTIPSKDALYQKGIFNGEGSY